MLELLSVPAIIALVEALKTSGMSARLAPATAIGAGVAFGFIIGEPVQGLVLGLAASGLYSSTKKVLERSDVASK